MGCTVLGPDEEIINEKLKQFDGNYLLPEHLARRDKLTSCYKISKAIIGEGSSGQVCIGIKNNKKYAIKKIAKSKIKFPSQMILEAEISLKVKHKSIMNYIEIFEDLKYISCVMELIEGGDLFDFILNHPLGHLPDDMAIDLMTQIFEVLDYLHSVKNIVHRDLKPENFLVQIDEDNKPILKLIDFGFAAYIPHENDKLNKIVGTRAYSAPEVFEKTGYREKVDEWSAGVIMFNMLTGYEPFVGKTPSQLIDSIKYDKVNFDLIQNKELRAINKKLLNRDVQKRISAKEALGEIYKLKNLNFKNKTNEKENDNLKKEITIIINNRKEILV
jgi:calcium-dependent protein kinase